MKTLFSLLLLGSLLNAQDGITYDSSSGLLWQDNKQVSKKLFTYEQAEQFCANLVIGEYSDFRVPSIYELQSIVDYRFHNPALLKGFKHSASNDYWSATPYAYRKGDYWTIDFKKGTTEPTGERYSKNLRCVQRIN
jgi:hypothetical protein